MEEAEKEKYQSIDCGGSSLEGEVLTVSTQPKRRNLRQYDPCLMSRSVGTAVAARCSTEGIPGIGSFPCRFRKAEYAVINC